VVIVFIRSSKFGVPTRNIVTLVLNIMSVLEHRLILYFYS
jgi:hypothetical protein